MLLSLPLVFLIWAIAAFVVSVAFHMFRGVMTSTNPGVLPVKLQSTLNG
jgi:hypothetical protein